MMKLPAGIVVALALALPAHAQRTAGHGGNSGHGGGSAHFGGMGHAGGRVGSMPNRGFAGRFGSPSHSGLTGLQSPSSFSSPGRFPMPGRLQPPTRNGAALPYRGQQFSGYRRGYGSHDPHRAPYRGHDRDRRRDRRWNRGSYGYGYGYSPGYLYTYPIVVDPGFYDWGATDYSEDEESADAGGSAYQGGPEYSGPAYAGPGYADQPAYPENPDAPYPPQRGNSQKPVENAEPQRQEYHFAAPTAATAKTERLKVIFKDGRAPMTIQNYMVNARSLTDLDSDHFVKIPLEQIDVAATQEANRSHGIDFQVPVPSRD